MFSSISLDRRMSRIWDTLLSSERWKIPNGDKVHSVIITSGEEGLEKPISILGGSSWGYFLWSFMNINQFKDRKLNPQKLRCALYFSVELHQAVSSAAEFCICLIYIHILHG